MAREKRAIFASVNQTRRVWLAGAFCLLGARNVTREERKEKEQLKYMKDGEFAVGFLSYPNMPFLQSNVANDIHYAIIALFSADFLKNEPISEISNIGVTLRPKGGIRNRSKP